MSADAFLRRVHRFSAILYLLFPSSPQAYFSLTGDPASPSPIVYIPLFPLLALTLTGTYQLVTPWVSRHRARRMPRGHVEASTKP